MLVVISPAKRLDWAQVAGIEATEPMFQADAVRLARAARKLSVADLRALMGISDDLAVLNRARFKAFVADPAPEITKPAALAFAGDTYIGLRAGSLDIAAINWAQDRLRILSGLYGVLRPLDRIQPYRLEMGSALETRRGKNLYAYWGSRIAKALTVAARDAGCDALVNCASIEYFGAVDLASLKLRVITPVFLEERDGQAKIVSFFAKQARGAMARFIVENRVVDPAGIKDFSAGGYGFRSDLSEGDRWIFGRKSEMSVAA